MNFIKNRSGVTMIEYALIAGIVSVVAIGLLSAMGTSVTGLFGTVTNALSSADVPAAAPSP